MTAQVTLLTANIVLNLLHLTSRKKRATLISAIRCNFLMR